MNLKAYAMPIRRNNDMLIRRTRLTSTVCAVLCLGFALPGPIITGDPQLAERLYEAAMAQAGRVSAKESIRAFQRVLNANRDFAPAGFDVLGMVTV